MGAEAQAALLCWDDSLLHLVRYGLDAVETAIHEAGHIVIGVRYRWTGLPCPAYVSIEVHGKKTRGCVSYSQSSTCLELTRRDFDRIFSTIAETDLRGWRWAERRIVVLLAGAEAVRKAFPERWAEAERGGQGDWAQAAALCGKMHCGSELVAHEHLRYLRARTRALLDRPEFFSAVLSLAEKLCESKRLDGKTAARIVRRAMAAGVEGTTRGNT
jgi:hypothetical protein